MTEIETIARAQTYLEKLANGVDPLTEAPVNEDDVVNNVRISKCLSYVSGILKQIVDNKGRLKIEMPDRADYTLTPEQVSNFAYSQLPIPVSEITRRLNDLVNPLLVQDLKRGAISDWLTDMGLLSEIIVNNKARKRPTAAGKNLGIIVEERSNQYGIPYEGVFYDLNAQHFILDHIDMIIEKIAEEQQNNKQNRFLRQHRTSALCDAALC